MTSKFYTTTALIIGILILLNLLASQYHARLDLTEDRQYTLSEATKNVLRNLEEPVTVKAYFSKELPPNIAKTRDDFQNLLVEYANRSDDQVLFEFINPNENESIEQEALQHGIQPVLLDIREKDQITNQKAFLGATIELGDKKEVIPFVNPGAAMEFALTTAIKKISITVKPTIGFITGHGEASIAEMNEVNNALNVLYQTTEVRLTDTTDIPDDIKTLALIRPTDSIPPAHLEKIDKFLARGGRLLIAFNRVHGDLRSFYGYPLNTGIETWLQQKGAEVVDNFVVDAQCGSFSMPQQFGAFMIQTQVSFPYVPIISTFSNHPATQGLDGLMLEFASEIRPNGRDSTVKFTPLAFSSDLSAAQPAPQYFDVNKKWEESDFTRQKITVAASLERIGGENDSRMMIIADGDFPVNGMGQQARKLQGDNINLVVNGIDWLTDDTGLIELRTKGAAFRPIQKLDDTVKTILKYVNFLLPVVLVVVYGVVRAQNNRSIRRKRMNERYIASAKVKPENQFEHEQVQ